MNKVDYGAIEYSRRECDGMYNVWRCTQASQFHDKYGPDGGVNPQWVDPEELEHNPHVDYPVWVLIDVVDAPRPS